MLTIQILRIIGIIEGISYVSLLFVAMPLKYMAGMPEAVRIVGSIHGGLFVAFAFALIAATLRNRWPIFRSALVFGSSLIPFGPIFIDPTLRHAMEEAQARGSEEVATDAR